MKTMFLTALLAVGLASTVAADNFDNNAFTTTLTDGTVEFSASTMVDQDLTGFGNDYELGVLVTVHGYNLGDGYSELDVYGALGEQSGDDYGVVGAEYSWWTGLNQTTDFKLAADAEYTMMNNFDNGVLELTPSAELSVLVAQGVLLKGQTGYAWDATNDFNSVGGYATVSADFEVNEVVTVTPSVSQPFDSQNDDLSAGLEVSFSY